MRNTNAFAIDAHIKVVNMRDTNALGIDAHIKVVNMHNVDTHIKVVDMRNVDVRNNNSQIIDTHNVNTLHC